MPTPPPPQATEAPTPTDYQTALDSQGACNLSGLVFEFARLMEKICTEARASNRDTHWKNTHPICRLFAEQIMHLTGSDAQSYAAAYEHCQERAATSGAA